MKWALDVVEIEKLVDKRDAIPVGYASSKTLYDEMTNEICLKIHQLASNMIADVQKNDSDDIPF